MGTSDEAAPDQWARLDVARRLHSGSAAHCTDLCRGYHGAWGWLRLYRPPRAVERDHDLLLDRFGALAVEGHRRVLVSGSSDPGLVAYVIEGFRRAGVEPSIHAVDQCRTPLEAIDWYGRELGADVTTTCGDILAFTGTDFDLVAAHNFLNFFSPEGRIELARSWRSALRPGGAGLVLARLRPDRAPGARRYGPERTELLVEQLLLEHAASEHRDAISPEDLEAVTRDFAEKRRGIRIPDHEALVAPFLAADLEVVEVTTHAPTRGVVVGEADDRRCLRFRRPDLA